MRGLVRLFAVALCMTGPYHMLMPVLPLLVRDAGGAASLAGVLTGAMALGAVTLELTGPLLIRRWPAAAVLACAFGLSGCAVVGLSAASTMWVAVAFSVLFGAGFGGAAAIIAMLLAPMDRHGETRATYGVYAFGTSLPSIVAAPGALLLATHAGVDGVLLVCALVAGVGVCASGVAKGAWVLRPPTARSLLKWTPGRIGRLGPYGCLSFTYGAVVGFAAFYLGPGSAMSAAAFLLVLGISRTVARTAAPYVVKAAGLARSMTFALGTGAVGLVVLAADRGWSVLAAGLLYGAAFGFLQTASLMAVSSPDAESNDAALWTFVTDAAIGLGALVMAPLGATFGYGVMYAVLPVILVAGLAGHVRLMVPQVR